MPNLELFQITKHDIIPIRSATPEDVILVLDRDTKILYLYKGHYSLPIDEFGATVLYERIVNRFLNPNILLLKTLAERSDDTEDIIKVKEFIVDSYPNISKFEFKRMLRHIFLLQGLRDKIKAFKNYENSREWRSKVSNTTNLWRLSWFNSLAILSVVLILFLKLLLDLNQGDFIFINDDNTINKTLWALWLENLSLTIGLCVFILAIICIVNILFILFPLKFPINPKAMQTLSEGKDSALKSKMNEITQKSMPLPPSPKLPGGSAQSQSSNEPKTAQITKTGILAPKLNIDISKKTPTISSSSSKTDEFDSDELDVPTVPLKKKITPKLTGTTVDIAGGDKLEVKDTPDTKYIVIDCPICNNNLVMPVPRKLITTAKEPVVEVSYLHGKQPHVLVAQLDHDYDVRRRRASWVVFEESKK